MKRRAFNLIAAIVLCAGASACLVPPFSSLQDARPLGPGNVAVTPFYSTIVALGGGLAPRHQQDDFGFQVEAGVLRWLDFGLRYEYLHHPDSGERYDEDVEAHTFAAGPKFSLVKDSLAVSLPIGCAIGEDIHPEDTWEFLPTVLVTLPMSPSLDINLAAKALIPFRKEANTLYAINAGAGIRIPSSGFSIRPEAGILFDIGEDSGDTYFQLSLGVTYRFGK